MIKGFRMPLRTALFMEERRGLMAVIDSAYSYYLSTYSKSGSSRYDTHKKSELRNVYKNIVKVNKDSPLYKLRRNAEVSKFLIDIKENARQVKNVAASLSSDTGGLKNAFQKKVATSSDEDIVSASYIGDNADEDASQSFDIEVRRLATPQMNLGNFLDGDSLDIVPGDYSFDLSTHSHSYEFQYTVTPDDTNADLQRRLANLVDSSGTGLNAEVVTDEAGRSALKIASKQTGRDENESTLFDIKPTASAGSMEAMNVLGIQQISSPAENSSFLLNGTEHSSYSNTFTINRMFELTLHGISPEDTPTNIGFKTNVDAVADNLQGLVGAYNHFIETGEKYSTTTQGNSLLRDLRNVSFSFRNDLESVGMVVETNGAISIDKDLLADAVDREDQQKTFSVLNSFKNALYAKADNASVNPIKYIDKTIVAYKRPKQNFPSPYYTSLYSGMMLDHFC